MGKVPHTSPLHDMLYGLHKSFGVLVFFLCLLRVWFRLNLGAPTFPATIPVLEKRLAHIGHGLFYLFMLAMPLSGYLMSTYFGFGVKFFGFPLPKLVGIDLGKARFFAEVHQILGYILTGLIVLHISGVIKHYCSEKINLLKRMV